MDHITAIDELLVRQLLLARADEVLSLFEPQGWTDNQQRVHRLINELQTRVQPHSKWSIEVSGLISDFPAPQIPYKKCAKFLQGELARLPTPNSGHKEPGRRSSTEYEFQGGKVVFGFVPKAEGGVDPPAANIVANNMIVGGTIELSRRLREKINKKDAKDYGLEKGTPYLVFAALLDSFGHDTEVRSALYGSWFGSSATGQTIRRNDGLFAIVKNQDGNSNATNTGLSAVGVCARYTPWTIEQTTIAIYDNPNARSPWSDLLPCTRRLLQHDDGQLDEVRGDVENLRFLAPAD